MSDRDPNPAVYRTIVGISKRATGATLTLDCKHTVPELPYYHYRLGNLHLCYRCSAKTIEIRKKRHDGGTARKRFQVIMADPPWRFQAWSHRGEGKGASQHYDCLSLEDICALPVSEVATDDAVLFLWVVQPMLPEGLRVMEAWGFKFKTVAFVWVKMAPSWNPDQLSMFETGNRLQPRLGLGYHTRSGAEQCWLGIRGQGYRRQEQGIEQVIHAPMRSTAASRMRSRTALWS